MTNITELSHIDRQQIAKVKSILQAMVLPFRKLVENSVVAGQLHHFYVSGGVIASLIQDDKVHDIDIYCRQEKTMDNLTEYILAFKENTVATYDEKYRDVIGHPKGRVITENAMTLDMNPSVQLITKHYGEPETVRSTFDFVHCTPYYEFVSDLLYISPKQFHACKNKLLIVNNAMNVGEIRLQKFGNRGYQLEDKGLLDGSVTTN